MPASWISDKFEVAKSSATSFSVLYSLIGISCFICCIPNILGLQFSPSIKNTKSTPLQDAVKSHNLEISLLISICISSTPLLELLFHSITHKFHMRHNVLFTWICLLAIIIPHLIIYTIVVPGGNYRLLPAIASCRNLFVLTASLSLLSCYDPCIWKIHYLLVGMSLYTINVVVSSFQPFLTSTRVTDALLLASLVPALLIFGIMAIRWFLHIYHISFTQNKPINATEICCTGHTIAFIALVTARTAYSQQYQGRHWTDRGADFFEFQVYLFTAYAVLVSILNSFQVIAEIIVEKRNEEAHLKQMIVGYFSHELRSPLNSAIMGLQVLKNELQRREVHSSKVKGLTETVIEIENSCGSVVDILNDLVTYERIENGEFNLEQRDVLLKPLLDMKFSAFRKQAQDTGVEFRVFFKTTDLSSARIHADEARIRQVLRNLLSNAFLSAGAGGLVEVVVSTTQAQSLSEIGILATHPETLLIEVRDSGRPFSEAAQAKMFHGNKIEFTAGVIEAGKAGGLGILISHRIMLLHQGQLSYSTGGHSNHSYSHSHGNNNNNNNNDLDHHNSSRIQNIFKIEIPMRSRAAAETNSVNGRTEEKVSERSINPAHRAILRILSGTLTIPRATLFSRRNSLRSPSFRAPPPSPSQRQFSRRVQLLQPTHSYRSHARVSDVALVGRTPSHSPPNHHSSSSVSIGGQQRASQETRRSQEGSRKSSSVASIMSVKTINTDQPMLPRGSLHSTIVPSLSEEVNPNPISPTLSTFDIPKGLKSKANTSTVVLVVDDVMMNRKMLCRLLEGQFDLIETAEDGQVAVDSVRKRMEARAPFNLVLMDYQMPNMDGPTAAKLMREMGFTGPIIGVTGNVLAAHTDNFIAHGANKVLHKPLSYVLLKEVLEGYL